MIISRKFIASLLGVLALVGVALPAQALSPQQRVVIFNGQRPALDLNFAQLSALPSSVTFTRTSAAYDGLYTDAAGSSYNTYASGVPRLNANGKPGLWIYQSYINELINSDSAVTQTTSSLSTGTYNFWCIGTGSVTTSAGTATGSGFGSQACSSGTTQTITLTGAGTVAATVTGSVDRFQLSNTSLPVPYCKSGASATTCNAESAVPSSLFSGAGAFTWAAKYVPQATGSNSSVVATTPVSSGAFIAMDASVIGWFVSGSTSLGTATAGASNRLAASVSGSGAWNASLNGAAAIAGSSDYRGNAAGLTFGKANTTFLNGQLQHLQIYNSILPSSRLQALSSTSGIQ